jgi:hypothetical protein|nr:MAG TPA: hypothetical protein [Caudoviricetes sp.]
MIIKKEDIKSIKQRTKGIKRLKKNIYRFNSEIEFISEEYLHKF